MLDIFLVNQWLGLYFFKYMSLLFSWHIYNLISHESFCVYQSGLCLGCPGVVFCLLWWHFLWLFSLALATFMFDNYSKYHVLICIELSNINVTSYLVWLLFCLGAIVCSKTILQVDWHFFWDHNLPFIETKEYILPLFNWTTIQLFLRCINYWIFIMLESHGRLKVA